MKTLFETLRFPFVDQFHSAPHPQIQDASNHLMEALSILKSPPLRYIEKENKVDFKSADEVITIINSIMQSLLKGRNSLITPRKRTLSDIQNSFNNKSLTPLPPKDIAISFYIQVGDEHF